MPINYSRGSTTRLKEITFKGQREMDHAEQRKSSVFSLVSCHTDFSCSLRVSACMQPSHLNTVSTCMYTVAIVSSSKVTCPTICYQCYLSKPSLKITASLKEFKLHKTHQLRDTSFTATFSRDWHNTNPVDLRPCPSIPRKMLGFWGCSICFWYQNPSHPSLQRLKF